MPQTPPPHRPLVQAQLRNTRIIGPSPLPGPSAPGRSPTLAAILSFLVPGLGQLLSGRIRPGFIFLTPVALLTLAGAALLAGDRSRLLGFLVRPEVLVGLFVVNLLLMIWRGAAIVDAWRGARRPRARPNTLGKIVAAALVLVVAGTHIVVGGTTYLVYDTLTAVFSGSGGDFGSLPESSQSASTSGGQPVSTSGATPVAVPTPRPVPQPLADGRLDVLLVGGDAGPGRFSLRTDTLIVLSVDVKTGHAALFGIPRNLLMVPLPPESRAAYPCGCFPGFINALYVYASSHPAQFPGSDETRGLLAIQGAMGELTGLNLDGMVLVKLEGFVRLVDAIGGLDLNVPYGLHDNHYPTEDGKGYIVVDIKAGQHHFAGSMALAYARSRHQDSDYGRMARQQLTLTALGRQLTNESLITKVPELLDIAKTNLWTNLGVENLSDLIELALRVDIPTMAHVSFIPPLYPESLTTAEIERIQTVAAEIFEQPEPSPSPAHSPSPGPSPKPGASPSP